MNIFSKALLSVARHAQRNKRAIAAAAVAGALVYPAARPATELAVSVAEAFSAYASGDGEPGNDSRREGVR